MKSGIFLKKTYRLVFGLVVDVHVSPFHRREFLQLDLQTFGSIVCNLDAFLLVHHDVHFHDQSGAAVVCSDRVDLLDVGRVGHGWGKRLLSAHPEFGNACARGWKKLTDIRDQSQHVFLSRDTDDELELIVCSAKPEASDEH